MWALASGHPLPRDIRPDQLSEEELIGFWADDVDPAASPASGQVCAMLAFDIVGFTRPDRDEETRIHIHKVLYEILRESPARIRTALGAVPPRGPRRRRPGHRAP
jgi:hypothetical protein